MSVSLPEIVAAARRGDASFVAESAGYLVLGLADGAMRSFRNAGVARDGWTAHLDEQGDVVTAGVERVTSEQEAERSLRRLLGVLLEAVRTPSPNLLRVARRTEARGLAHLVVELEAALVPVNRKAARRSLARLCRETLRAVQRGGLVPVPLEALESGNGKPNAAAKPVAAAVEPLDGGAVAQGALTQSLIAEASVAEAWMTRAPSAQLTQPTGLIEPTESFQLTEPPAAGSVESHDELAIECTFEEVPVEATRAEQRPALLDFAAELSPVPPSGLATVPAPPPQEPAEASSLSDRPFEAPSPPSFVDDTPLPVLAAASSVSTPSRSRYLQPQRPAGDVLLESALSPLELTAAPPVVPVLPESVPALALPHESMPVSEDEAEDSPDQTPTRIWAPVVLTEEPVVSALVASEPAAPGLASDSASLATAEPIADVAAEVEPGFATEDDKGRPVDVEEPCFANTETTTDWTVAARTELTASYAPWEEPAEEPAELPPTPVPPRLLRSLAALVPPTEQPVAMPRPIGRPRSSDVSPLASPLETELIAPEPHVAAVSEPVASEPDVAAMSEPVAPDPVAAAAELVAAMSEVAVTAAEPAVAISEVADTAAELVAAMSEVAAAAAEPVAAMSEVAVTAPDSAPLQPARDVVLEASPLMADLPVAPPRPVVPRPRPSDVTELLARHGWVRKTDDAELLTGLSSLRELEG